MQVNIKLLGRRIKEERTKKGLSQAELAARCGTSAQYLSQIENGKKKASLYILMSLAQALEVTLDELLAGNQVDNLEAYNKEIGKIFQDCSSYEKRVLFELIMHTKDVLRDNENILMKDLN